MKLVFFGSSRYVIPILNSLHNKHTVLLVVTTEQGSQEPVKLYCQTHKINCISIRKAGDLLANQEIQRTNADAGIVADFGVIIPQSVLDYFPMGILNVHPSLLPKYRGPTPVQTALINGDKTTGVSIMLLDKFMDHGPIFMQQEEIINPDDNAKNLYEKLFKLGATLLLDVLQKYEHKNIIPKPQDEARATVTKFLTREDGFINPNELRIENWKLKIEPMIRAYYPWPGTWTKTVLNLHQPEEKIVKFLPQNYIQVEGKKEMLIKDFLNGYPNAENQFLDFLRKAFA